MAKNKGTFKTSANYQVKAAEALDPRTQWDDIVTGQQMVIQYIPMMV